MARSKLAEAFVAKLEEGLKGDKAVRDAIGFIQQKVTTETDLRDCLWEYASTFDPSAPEHDRAAQQRGLMIGFNLFARSIELAGPLDTLADLVPRVARQARDPSAEIDPIIVMAAARWEKLSADDRRQLEARAQKKKSELRDRQTLVSPLVKAFVAARPAEKPTVGALRSFDPAPDPELRKQLDAAAFACRGEWSTGNWLGAPLTEESFKTLEAAGQRFVDFLRAKASEPLPLFQVMKWLREGEGVVHEESWGRVTTAPSWSVVWKELYEEAVMHAVRMAQTKWNMLLVQRAKGFLPEDREFFLGALPKPRDRELLEGRVKWMMRDLTGYLELTRGRRRHRRFAAHAGVELVDELDTVKLLNQIAELKKNKPGRLGDTYVQVNDFRLAFSGKYRVGQEILEDFTIIWIENAKDDATIYVEFLSLECVLFRATPYRLARLTENALYKMLARNAQALAIFMLAYLELLGLVLDVITAGSTGGFRHFVFAFLKERLKEKATDLALDVVGIDDPALRTAVGMGANFVRAPKFKPRAELELDTHRAAAVARKGLDTPATSPKVAPYTAAERKALADADVSVVDFTKKKGAVVKSEKQAAQVVEEQEMEAVAMAAGGRRGTNRPATGRVAAVDTGAGVAQIGSRTTPRRPLPPDAVPEMPHTPRAPGNYEPGYLRLFYQRNRRSYPPDIAAMIDALPDRDISRAAVERIDTAIRQRHTDVANAMAGYANRSQQPFIRSVRGASNEGGRFSSAVTDGKNLSLHGQLRGGGIAEFDAVRFRSKTIVETKMNLKMKSDQDIYDQMMRQARFADEWGFSQVHWEVWAPDVGRARRIMDKLRHDNPKLGARLELANPNDGPGSDLLDLM